MRFIKGNYRKDIPKTINGINDIMCFDNVHNIEQNDNDLSVILDNVQKILVSNKNVQSVKCTVNENVLIFISSVDDKTCFEKSLDLIIESNISINNYLYPSECIEQFTDEDIWYYPNLDLIVLKYDGDILMKLV